MIHRQEGAFCSASSDCPQSLAEFAAGAAKKISIIFRRGVYVAENTSQAVSVRVVRLRRTRSARSRLQSLLPESPKGDFRQSEARCRQFRHLALLWRSVRNYFILEK